MTDTLTCIVMCTTDFLWMWVKLYIHFFYNYVDAWLRSLVFQAYSIRYACLCMMINTMLYKACGLMHCDMMTAIWGGGTCMIMYTFKYMHSIFKDVCQPLFIPVITRCNPVKVSNFSVVQRCGSFHFFQVTTCAESS